MPIAAVPSYLPASQFAGASPALRFGLLLPVWTDRRDQVREVLDRASKKSPEAQVLQQQLGTNHRNLDQVVDRLIQAGDVPMLWKKNDRAAPEAWKQVAVLTGDDTQLMKVLAARQKHLAERQPSEMMWSCEADATAPFTTGLGNEHPLENGFSFLNPYGLPYLPGSGVKGVVREAARQLAEGLWDDSRGWHKEPVGAFTVREGGEERRVQLTALDVLFGRETREGESDHFRGVLRFWDVIPVIEGKPLRIEVMTPHQSHYYQQKTGPNSGDSIPPHDSGQPNPILFLTVPPGSRFAFHVSCDLGRLRRTAQTLVERNQWKELLENAFEHAFQWLGFGAKTAVGYGAMQSRRRPQSTPSAEGPQAGQKSEPTAAAANEAVWENATLVWSPGSQELKAISGNNKATLIQAEARAFLEAMPEDKRELLKKKKQLSGVKVRVRVEGNKATIAGLA
ncbi:MAG: type III-B CRISPR module RAMP protein Cmr6 [Bryobacteraceae bacterium]